MPTDITYKIPVNPLLELVARDVQYTLAWHANNAYKGRKMLIPIPRYEVGITDGGRTLRVGMSFVLTDDGADEHIIERTVGNIVYGNLWPELVYELTIDPQGVREGAVRLDLVARFLAHFNAAADADADDATVGLGWERPFVRIDRKRGTRVVTITFLWDADADEEDVSRYGNGDFALAGYLREQLLSGLERGGVPSDALDVTHMTVVRDYEHLVVPEDGSLGEWVVYVGATI